MSEPTGYEAIFGPITNVRKHSNADRLLVGEVNGYSVIVDLETKEGEMGVLIREGSQLSQEFVIENKLYKKHPITEEEGTGFIGSQLRVKCLKLRGEKSEGIFLGEECLAFLNAEPCVSGAVFDEVNGTKFVWKYESEAQIKAQRNRDANAKKQRKEVAAFRKHYNTSQLRDTAGRLADIDGAKFIWTEKLHGTSGRTARVEAPLELGRMAKVWNLLFGWAKRVEPKMEMQAMSGTRNCILNPKASGEKAAAYRQICHERISQHLNDGITVYYEIVGFTENGASIMSTHPVDELKGTLGKKEAKAFVKEYGDKPVVYTYGCNPRGDIMGQTFSLGVPRFRIFVYRMTEERGVGAKPRELTWSQVCRTVFCWDDDSIEVVPQLDILIPAKSSEVLISCANSMTRGPSTVDASHIREGVCLRVEHMISSNEEDDSYERITIVEESVKQKGFVFCSLEGIRANDPEFIDLEAMS